MVDGHEIIRRIFVTVRNAKWQEIAPVLVEIDGDMPGQAHLRASYQSALIDFDWDGIFDLDPVKRLISFGFDGVVPRDGTICRLGLVVLLPPAMVAGATGSIVTRDGQESIAIPDLLGAQPIVNGWPTGLTTPFERIKLAPLNGARLDLELEGEFFEIEDQRNWGDASYKIYCTPLSVGFPRKVVAGQRIAHRVIARYEVPAKRRAGIAAMGAARRFPLIGVEARAETHGIKWSHLSCPIGIAEEFGRAQSLEVRLGSTALEDPGRVREQLRRLGNKVTRLLLHGVDERPPEADALRLLKTLAEQAGLTVSVFAAATGYFVEFNRGLGSVRGADGLAWPLAPTVHSSDLDTVFENITPFTALARFARTLEVGTHHAVSPLCWSYPGRSEIEASHNDVLLWLTAVLIDAAAAEIESVTLSAELTDFFAGTAASLEALAALVALGGSLVRPLVTSLDGIVGMLVEHKDEWIVVNATRHGQMLVLPGSFNVIADDVGCASHPDGGLDLPVPARWILNASAEPEPGDGAMA